MKREKINNYKDLIVWQKSIDLVVEVYTLTKNLPKEEQYGICSQMRRSAISIPLNIAEGSRRGTKKDYRKFLFIAFGSGAELETQMVLVQKLYNVPKAQIEKIEILLEEVMKILNTLTKKLDN